MATTLTPVEQLKMNLLEDQYPYFTGEQLQYIIDKCNGNVTLASYEGCKLKAVNDSLSLGRLQTPDNSKFWKTLAKSYRPDCSQTIMRADEIVLPTTTP